MNPLAKMLIDMARFYGYELEERQLEMYVGVLEKFPIKLVHEAIAKYTRNIKNEKFPIPVHKIMADHIPKEPEQVDLAREAAARVIEAVSRFGYSNAVEAKGFIGELGWMAVGRFGGWSIICQNLGDSIATNTFYAQCRDLCKSTLALYGAGINNEPIRIGESKKVLSLISTLANDKSLEKLDIKLDERQTNRNEKAKS